jgi:TRAP-type C4-dicarboxylate transport system permease small subunit
MRNSIEKDSYKLLFGILTFFGIVLAFISATLYFNLNGFAPKTLSVSASLLFMLIGVTIWLRTEYLKNYNIKTYKTARIPMWFSAGLSLIVGIIILT